MTTEHIGEFTAMEILLRNYERKIDNLEIESVYAMAHLP